MKNHRLASIFTGILLALTIHSGALSQDTHPLEEFFQAEILSEKAQKEVKIHLELVFHQSPEEIEAEIYHTDLEKTIIGLIVEVENKAKELKYDVLIQMEVPPYKNVEGSQILHRPDDLKEEATTVTVKEVRYVELPDIDDIVTEPKEEEEESEDE